MTQEFTAEQLMAGVAGRNEEMLGMLYDRYAPRLLGVISEIVADQDAAMEVLQELFAGVWKDARRIDKPRAGVMAWLVLDARARAVDRWRQDEGLRPAVHSGLKSLLKSTSWLPKPEEISIVDARRPLLNKVIRRLPPSQNHLVELAVFKGRTEAEIAAQLQQPLSRVESELRAALRFLRHRLRAVLGTWTADI